MKKIYPILFLILSEIPFSYSQSWEKMGGGVSIAVTCMALDTANNILYAGGNSGVVKWNGNTWSNMGSVGGGVVTAIVIYKGEVYIGGTLTTLKNVAKWSGTSWTTVGGGTNGLVKAMTVYNDKLVVSGSYTMSGTATTYGIANWDGAAWSNFGAGYPYNPSGSSILTMPVFNGELHAGGGQLSLMTVDPYSCLAKYNGAWSDISGGAGLSFASVYALAVHNNELYAGGSFTGPAARITKWNGASWVSVGAGMDTTVFALHSYNNELYAGGAFTIADGDSARYIAKWNGVKWVEANGGMGTVGNQPYVFALSTYNNCLIAGGQFTNAGGTAMANIARLCSVATVVPQDDKDAAVIITQNAGSSKITIFNTQALNEKEPAMLKIFDLCGRIVMEKNVEIGSAAGSKKEIDIAALPEGLYVYLLTNYETLNKNGKLLITR